jgi:hypothetical protein
MKNKKFKIEYLGDKEICLEKNENEASDRIDNCNQLINLIADKDRKFFSRQDNGNLAKFGFVDGKLIYFDAYTGMPIKKTYNSDKYKWKGKFSDGGTLQDVIQFMSVYILSGIPFFIWCLRINDWGYSDESVQIIKQEFLDLKICTKTNRFMFYLRHDNDRDIIFKFIDNSKELDKNKCIIVDTQVGDCEPYWLGEFNFIYSKYK